MTPEHRDELKAIEGTLSAARDLLENMRQSANDLLIGKIAIEDRTGIPYRIMGVSIVFSCLSLFGHRIKKNGESGTRVYGLGPLRNIRDIVDELPADFKIEARPPFTIAEPQQLN